MALMTAERVRHLPVLEGKKMAGIVSIGDLVHSIIIDQKFVIAVRGRGAILFPTATMRWGERVG
jgi:CBS domain-containing protein